MRNDPEISVWVVNRLGRAGLTLDVGVSKFTHAQQPVHCEAYRCLEHQSVELAEAPGGSLLVHPSNLVDGERGRSLHLPAAKPPDAAEAAVQVGGRVPGPGL